MPLNSRTQDTRPRATPWPCSYARPAFDGHLQHLSHMEGVSVGALGNLFAATETVSDDQPVRGRSTNRREKLELSR